ncbi:hypothetical protein DFQ59_104170 [Thioalbus denitrificans]|uniref:Peptidase YpeB-like protein n=2 Tax=Thioalbus denitrificans TaxID=547122 RepID=A0A369CFX2_9GAMM|nr:hypothetical protein DFQ59_104170 [Thioalbus denitrificans]
MKNSTIRIIALVAVTLALLLLVGVQGLRWFLERADERNLERLAALQVIVDRAEREQGGEVVGSRLDDRAGRPVYELTLRLPDGRLRRLQYDLDSGEPLPAQPPGE